MEEFKANILPINDRQIRAYGLLQLISKAEMAQPSPYDQENIIRKRNIEEWRREYYELIGYEKNKLNQLDRYDFYIDVFNNLKPEQSQHGDWVKWEDINDLNL